MARNWETTAPLSRTAATEKKKSMNMKIETPPSETALYIEKMCGELRNMAARAELNLLAYLLEVAREEAAQQTVSIRKINKPPETR